MCDTFLTWTAAQVQFDAEDELVTIVPNIKMPILNFIMGAVGPFIPGQPIQVPLWLAISMKQRQTCQVVPPPWLKYNQLREIVQNERSLDRFQPLPSPHFLEIITTLLEIAESDVIGKNTDGTLIRSLVEELWVIRANKLRAGLRSIANSDTIVSVSTDNLTPIEINKIRPFIREAVKQLQVLNKEVEQYNPSSQGMSSYRPSVSHSSATAGSTKSHRTGY